MSNFYRAVKALNDVDEAIDHLADNAAYVTALAAQGLLAPDKQVIRTVEELEALDPKTILIDSAKIYTVCELKKMYEFWRLPEFPPIAILATGDQVRAAREAMAQEHG